MSKSFQSCQEIVKNESCQKIVKNYEKENIGNIGQEAQLAKLPHKIQKTATMSHRKT
jgi:hypothetical protein